MAGAPGGLGRGLANLIPKKTGEKDTQEVLIVSVDKIRPNPNQPRFEFSQEALLDLSESIKRQGVLQPVLVRQLSAGEYELVAGERRLRASRLAGVKTIPALVRELTEEESLAIALIENLQREDLNPMDEARGLQRLQETFHLSQEELASRVGKSRSAIANTLRLLALPEPAQEGLKKGDITAGHARALLSVTDPEAMLELYSRIVRNGLTVRQVEAAATHFKAHGVLPPSEVETAPGAPGAGRGRATAARDEYLSGLATLAASRLGSKVEFKGSRSRGQVVLRYKSEEELSKLLAALGLEAGE